MLPTAQSPAQIQPCSLSSHNQPQVVSEGSVFTCCSFCPEPPAPSCRLTPTTLLPSSLLWELGLGIRMGSQLPQPHPHPLYYHKCLSAPLGLSQDAELLKASSSSFVATPGAKHRPYWESTARRYLSTWMSWKPV